MKTYIIYAKSDIERIYSLRNRIRLTDEEELASYILFAFLFEKNRSASNDLEKGIAQTISTLGRNYFIGMALEKQFPELNNSERGYLGRIITLMMTGDSNPENYSRNLLREHIVQEVSENYPDYEISAKAVDLIVDIIIQRSKKK